MELRWREPPYSDGKENNSLTFDLYNVIFKRLGMILFLTALLRRHNILQNDMLQNDTQHNDTKQND